MHPDAEEIAGNVRDPVEIRRQKNIGWGEGARFTNED
jgi:hypothetical protein